MGDDVTEIWGSAITTMCLAEAMEELGHTVWRASATATADWTDVPIRNTDLIISEGVSADRIPEPVWATRAPVLLWCLSSLHLDSDALPGVLFSGIASNSAQIVARLNASGRHGSLIELAASASYVRGQRQSCYESRCVYLGCYPHKAPEQMELLFRPAEGHGLSIWGYGWEDSPYADSYRGLLPLRDIPGLYHSADIVLALTERCQMALGMVNNRVFEALACGAVVLSEFYPALASHDLGPFVNFVESPSTAAEFLDRFFSEATFAAAARTKALAGQRAVLDRHGYRDRAEKFIALWSTL